MASLEKVKHTCNQCGKNLSSKSTLKRHELTHIGHKPHTCESCSKSFARKTHLSMHLRTHTGEKPYSCTICSKSFANCSHLKLHARVHTGEKPYSCDLCFKTFGYADSLANHRKTHTGKKNRSCTYCEKTYGTHEGLQRHLRLHTGEKPFACTYCNQRRFYTATELARHVKVCNLSSNPPANVMGKIHECEVCHKQFSAAGALQKHKATRHETDPPSYSCDKCGRTFKHRDYLYAHQKTHSTVKSEKCFLCPAVFKSKGDLAKHIKRKHTGEKSVACPADGCDSRFFTNWDMKDHHKRIHESETPHRCPHPHCAKRFAIQQDMTRHMQAHTGSARERPYVCEMCDKRFTTNWCLNSSGWEEFNLCDHCKGNLEEVQRVFGTAGATSPASDRTSSPNLQSNSF